jgi:hypothetical protein
VIAEAIKAFFNSPNKGFIWGSVQTKQARKQRAFFIGFDRDWV